MLLLTVSVNITGARFFPHQMKVVNMNVTSQVKPYFNNKAPRTTLISFGYDRLRWELDTQNLKKLAPASIIFVFNQDKNAWAYDFISDFKAHVPEWMEDEQSPEFGYIMITEARSDLQEQILHHPLFNTESGVVPLIVSIGDVASAEVARYRSAYGRSDIPQLFCVTGDPERLELVDCNGHLLANTNGVCAIEARKFEKQVRTLKSLSGAVKTVAIVSGISGRFDLAIEQRESAAQKVIDECARQGLSAHRLFLIDGMDVENELAALAKIYDAIITLQDDTIYSVISQLADFCNNHKVIFFSSELASVKRGAAIGYGNAPAAYVPYLIELMALQKENHMPLDTFELAALEDSIEMRYNMNGIRKQVRDLTQEKEDLLDMVSIYAGC
ncbi:MAG: transporter substrate binding protein [Candidatus Dependentiae bacterium]|nr:transporter substrate binding protein [Candidatus Dependentiae bacterium]